MIGVCAAVAMVGRDSVRAADVRIEVRDVKDSRSNPILIGVPPTPKPYCFPERR
jgi:hypothetical protein